MRQELIELHPSQLSRALHNLSAAGVDPKYAPLPNGMCVIVVMLPDEAEAPPDWREAPQRAPQRGGKRWPVNVQVAAMVVIVAFCAWIAYTVFGGAALLPADLPAGLRGAVTGVMGLVGWIATLAVIAGALWLGRPLVAAMFAAGRAAVGAVGRLRR